MRDTPMPIAFEHFCVCALALAIALAFGGALFLLYVVLIAFALDFTPVPMYLTATAFDIVLHTIMQLQRK